MSNPNGFADVFDETADIEHLLRLAEFYTAAQVATSLSFSLPEFIKFCVDNGIPKWPRANVNIVRHMCDSKFLTSVHRGQLVQHLQAWRDFPSVVAIMPDWVKALVRHALETHALSTLMQMAVTMNLEDAAKKMGIGMSSMKNFCRKHGVTSWPHRALAAIAQLETSTYLTVEEKQGVSTHMKTWVTEPLVCISPVPHWVDVLKRRVKRRVVVEQASLIAVE